MLKFKLIQNKYYKNIQKKNQKNQNILEIKWDNLANVSFSFGVMFICLLLQLFFTYKI